MITKAYNDLTSSSCWKITKNCYLTAYTLSSMYTAVKVWKYLLNPIPENEYSRELLLFTMISAPYLLVTSISLLYGKITSISPSQPVLKKVSFQEVLINQQYMLYALGAKDIEKLKPLYTISKNLLPS